MDACAAGELDAEVVLVISNNSKSGALRRAREAGIEAVHISGKTHPGREDEEICARLRELHADWVLLLGYMKKIGDLTLEYFSSRIVNTHPALLPKFGGQNFYGTAVHEEVLKAGETKTGITVHYVSEEYDSGEIVLQREVPVFPTDTPSSLEHRVKHAEKHALVEAIRSLLNQR